MEIVEIAIGGVSIDVSAVGISLASVTAFLVGIVAIKTMLKITKSAKLRYFSYYLILISIISLFVL